MLINLNIYQVIIKDKVKEWYILNIDLLFITVRIFFHRNN